MPNVQRLPWRMVAPADAVGLVTFDQEIRRVIWPSSNQRSSEILHVMEEATATHKTHRPDFSIWPNGSAGGHRRIVSDLFDDVDSMLAGLKHLRPSAARCDRVACAGPGRVFHSSK
jgi:hypothetical protein